MIFRNEYRGGVWIDLEQPSEDEIRTIAQEFSIGERIETELLSPTPTPTVTNDGDAALLVFHFPAQNTENNEVKNQEIDFIVGKHFIITVRYELLTPLYHLKKLLEAQALAETHTVIETDILLEIIFVHLYTSMHDHANHVIDRLTRIEREMFGGNERATIRSISNINREFLHMEAAIANQEEPLDRFLKSLSLHKFFNDSFAERSGHILLERARISRILKTHRAIARELRETNLALIEAGQNEIMKTLTIVNFIFLPLGLISWIFSMRTEGTPIIDSPNAFWIVLAIMLSIAALLTAFFTKKRWLF